VCSPSEVSPYWLLVLLSFGGEGGRTLYQNETLQPEHVSELIARIGGMRRFNCTASTVATADERGGDSMIPSGCDSYYQPG
jgi:hypothetical protein